MGNAFVRGLQGASLLDGVVATAKHFVGYGASEGGLNWAPAHIPPRELREVYLHPFEAAVRTAGLRSVMNAYQELDGLPCAADHDLLTGVLRDEWGFDGYVVSDYFAVRQLEDYHQLAADASDAASIALTAGIDVELPSTDCYGKPLVDAVEAGIVALADLDRAVERVLRTKFELGLFEHPYVDIDAAPLLVGSAEGRANAAELARQSIVLLANDGVLPIDPASTATIAVIGPSADSARHLLGDYSYAAHIETLLEMRDKDNVFAVPIPADLAVEGAVVGGSTILEALAARFPAAAVRTAPGCGTIDPDRDGFEEAVALASDSDVAIVVVGDRAGLTYEATSGESRDRSSLDLPGVQEELVGAVLATGTPVVLVIVAGRPCGSVGVLEHCAAVVMAWLPGEQGAAAIADVIAGVVNPGGKLPVSFPRSAGHIPVYYRHKLSGGRSHWKGDYVDGPVSALYPFGHGCSYTTFELTVGAPAPEHVGSSDEVTVEVTVANTGERNGDEVVQLYTRDPSASLTRPVLELKAFSRVSVPAGEARRVVFAVPVRQLGFYDRNLRYVVEPGEIEVHVGTSAVALSHAGSFEIVTHDGAVEVEQSFASRVVVTDTVRDDRR
jgi:beta-glucosidase